MLPRLLDGLDVMSPRDSWTIYPDIIYRLLKYSVFTLTSTCAAVYMLLGALLLELELHKTRLSLLNRVITNENECLKGLVLRHPAVQLMSKTVSLIL